MIKFFFCLYCGVLIFCEEFIMNIIFKSWLYFGLGWLGVVLMEEGVEKDCVVGVGEVCLMVVF